MARDSHQPQGFSRNCINSQYYLINISKLGQRLKMFCKGAILFFTGGGDIEDMMINDFETLY